IRKSDSRDSSCVGPSETVRLARSTLPYRKPDDPGREECGGLRPARDDGQALGRVDVAGKVAASRDGSALGGAGKIVTLVAASFLSASCVHQPLIEGNP